MYKIHLIGVSNDNLAPGGVEAISECNIVFCTDRFRTLITDDDKTIYSISPLRSAFNQMLDCLKSGNVAFLASGDPLFFGIGGTLVNKCGKEFVEIYPAISSIQLAFAKLKTPWQDVFFMSRHGRNTPLTQDILSHEKICMLTDGKNSPQLLAKELLELLAVANIDKPDTYFTGFVAEDLGTANERLFSGKLSAICQKTFSDLSVFILVRQPGRKPLDLSFFGVKEGAITHSRGLITKDEIRAVCLHKLCLPASGVLWDIGAGSGSISIESARMNPHLTVYSIEQKQEEQDNILANIEKFNLSNMHLIKGQAPDALRNLPAPDRVFIGGSGGRFSDIAKEITPRLSNGGIVVATAVTQATRKNAPSILHANGFIVDLSEVSVCRSLYPSKNNKPINLNPITIITGTQ